MNDDVRRVYERCVAWCGGMPEDEFGLVFRLMMLFALPTIFCGLAFRKGSRSTMIQALCLTFGVLLACALPIGHPPRNEEVRTWIVAFSGVLLLFLPAMLPFFLTNRYGLQNKLRIALYLGLAIVVLVTMR